VSEFLRQLWEPIAKLPRSQQIALALVVGVVFVGVFMASMWGTQKEYIPLFEEQLKIEDAGKVVAKIKELNIDYKLGKDSSDIQVPLTDKSYILLQLSQEKVLPAARAGWQKLIDERSVFAGTTQQEFDLNFIRGLQDELESGLVRLSCIENARVYIVKPKREVFKEDQKDPTASVFLKIRPNVEITKDQVRAIRDWVSSAVEGLKPENVRITDTEARDLSRMLAEEEDMNLDKVKSVQMKHTKAYEKDLEKKLQSQLETVFGSGRAVVRVTAQLDFDQKEAISDIVIPPIEGSKDGIVISQKKENEEYEGKDLVQDGEPGVNSNLPPGAPSYPGTENNTHNKYKRNADISNYEVSRSKEKLIKEQGTLKRLSVSVILDGDPQKVGSNLEENIRSAAQATVGFSKKRGDVMTLMVYPFNNDMAERARREMEERQRQEKNMFMIVVGLLMSIPLLFGLVYIFARVSRARALAREKAALDQAAQEAEALRKAEELRRNKIREQQQLEWEQRFQDINNFFPDIKDVEEKKRKVQELRFKTYQYAQAHDSLPPDFDEMTPEEQYLYKEAFSRKADGTLDDGLSRLETLLGERDKVRKEELEKLQTEAQTRTDLEDRVRALISEKPEDAVQVLRIWLQE
jgi:flagellar M-ring protein FliF